MSVTMFAVNQYVCMTNSAFSASPRETLPVYDLDVNTVTNGPWAYTWDCENRMASACSNGVLLVTNVYDHMSRRIKKSSRGGAESAEFFYDGWNVVRETVAVGSGRELGVVSFVPTPMPPTKIRQGVSLPSLRLRVRRKP